MVIFNRTSTDYVMLISLITKSRFEQEKGRNHNLSVFKLKPGQGYPLSNSEIQNSRLSIAHFRDYEKEKEKNRRREQKLSEMDFDCWSSSFRVTDFFGKFEN